MLMSLKEAHHQFTNEHPKTRSDLVSFVSCGHIMLKLFDIIPYHVCICSYHENVRLLKGHTAFALEFHKFIGL